MSIRLPILLFMALSALPSSAPSAEAGVSGIRFRSYEGYTRVVVDLTGPAAFEKDRLNNPERLFIDIEGAFIGNVPRSMDIGDGILKKIRAAQYAPDIVRVVLDLDKFGDFKVQSSVDPPRVIIDIYASPQSGKAGKEAGKVALGRVVIDAGHGGHDPGAVGPGGLWEKDIVLDIAIRLKRLLDEQGIEAHLTRQDDTYLSLEERTVIANRKKADLFVSVHANANKNTAAKGIETYLLNWTDDEEAMKVAARENKITLRRMKESRSELDMILASLELQNKRDESLRLAHNVQRSMVSAVSEKYGGISDLGVKQALFYVLVGAEMPSVLAEVSFITNRQDALRLKSASYRQHLAAGMAAGVRAYFDSSGPVQKLAMESR